MAALVKNRLYVTREEQNLLISIDLSTAILPPEEQPRHFNKHFVDAFGLDLTMQLQGTKNVDVIVLPDVPVELRN